MMAYVMHDVNLDLSTEINKVPLELAETELATGLVVDEYEIEAGKVELGVGRSAVRTCGRGEESSDTSGEVEEMVFCGGGGVSPEGTGEDDELEFDGDEPLVILVIVNAGLVLPESPYTFGKKA